MCVWGVAGGACAHKILTDKKQIFSCKYSMTFFGFSFFLDLLFPFNLLNDNLYLFFSHLQACGQNLLLSPAYNFLKYNRIIYFYLVKKKKEMIYTFTKVKKCLFFPNHSISFWVYFYIIFLSSLDPFPRFCFCLMSHLFLNSSSV